MLVPMQIGMLEGIFSIFFVVIGIVAVIYFGIVPTFALVKLSKPWKANRRIVLVASYFAILLVLVSVIWGFPEFYLRVFPYLGLTLLSFPVVFIGVAAIARMIAERKQGFVGTKPSQTR